jgi:basic amino acid/polyamine antiporter, APA family
VLRRDVVEHDHFRAPTVFPVLGAIVALALIVDTLLDDPAVFARAGILLAVGVGLWFVNRLLAGPPDHVEAERLRG